MEIGPHVMDMGPDSMLCATRASEWLGVTLDGRQKQLLTRFRDWLEAEAIPGGGVGPNEAHRLWCRHIADAILFGVGLNGAADCVDVGSGAGLPGIPLAIMNDGTEFTLVDKSERRCDLIARAISVLRLENCSVVHSNVEAVDKTWGSLVSRAAIPPDKLLFHVKRLLVPGGTGAVGLTRSSRNVSQPSKIPPGLTASVIEIPADVLDTSIQILRIVAI